MRHYTRDDLLRLAASEDAGFSTETVLDALSAIKRLTDAAWAEDGIPVDSVPHLKNLFAEWRAGLASDEQLLRTDLTSTHARTPPHR